MDARIRTLAPLIALALVAGCQRPDATDTAATAPAPAPVTDVPAAPPAPVPLLDTRVAEGAGPYLVDSTGRSLYVFSEDVGSSACHDACTRRWPSLVAPAGDTGAPPMYGANIEAAQVANQERIDGLVQVTYAGRPLYLYTGDAEPGHRTGHDLRDEFGHWSLVGPDGKPLSTR